jgi:hypothetical protein
MDPQMPSELPGRHIALLGDSIFDNAVYTNGAPDVVTHLRAGLPSGWQATLLAVDGSTTRDVARQVAQVPPAVTDVVLSVGGNDALERMEIVNLPVRSTAQALSIFRETADTFRPWYEQALDGVLALGRRTTVCTIYEGNLDPPFGALARTALVLFNDVILRAAFARRLPVIDLRLVCTEPADYANPIEPSDAGGKKIAAAILAALGARGEAPAASVFGLASG